MKLAWTILLISALTDCLVAFGSALGAAMVESSSGSVGWGTVGVAAIGGGLAAARTIQQALKAVRLGVDLAGHPVVAGNGEPSKPASP